MISTLEERPSTSQTKGARARNPGYARLVFIRVQLYIMFMCGVTVRDSDCPPHTRPTDSEREAEHRRGDTARARRSVRRNSPGVAVGRGGPGWRRRCGGAGSETADLYHFVKDTPLIFLSRGPHDPTAPVQYGCQCAVESGSTARRYG